MQQESSASTSGLTGGSGRQCPRAPPPLDVHESTSGPTGGSDRHPRPPRPLDVSEIMVHVYIHLCHLCLCVYTLYINVIIQVSASTTGPSGASSHHATLPRSSSTVVQSQTVTLAPPLRGPAYGKRANLTVKPTVQYKYHTSYYASVFTVLFQQIPPPRQRIAAATLRSTSTVPTAVPTCTTAVQVR